MALSHSACPVSKLSTALCSGRPANGGDIRDTGLIPGLGRSLEEGMETHPSILASRIPMDKEAWWATV